MQFSFTPSDISYSSQITFSSVSLNFKNRISYSFNSEILPKGQSLLHLTHFIVDIIPWTHPIRKGTALQLCFAWQKGNWTGNNLLNKGITVFSELHKQYIDTFSFRIFLAIARGASQAIYTYLSGIQRAIMDRPLSLRKIVSIWWVFWHTYCETDILPSIIANANQAHWELLMAWINPLAIL